MSISIQIPDTHVGLLSDAVLADRVSRDLVNGWRSGGRTALIGGYTITVNDEQRNMRGWIDHLAGQKPGTAKVDRHDDGSVSITLSPAVNVYLVPSAVKR